jgi:hypothetical protein
LFEPFASSISSYALEKAAGLGHWTNCRSRRETGNDANQTKDQSYVNGVFQFHSIYDGSHFIWLWKISVHRRGGF